jgi:hypothetical protein
MVDRREERAKACPMRNALSSAAVHGSPIGESRGSVAVAGGSTVAAGACVCDSSVLRLQRLDRRDCGSPCNLLHCLASKFSACGSGHRRLCGGRIWDGWGDSLQAPWLTPNNHASALPQDRIMYQVDRYQATVLWPGEAVIERDRRSLTARLVRGTTTIEIRPWGLGTSQPLKINHS